MNQQNGKAQQPNKVSFSSIKHAQNKHGNLVSTIYFNSESAERLAGLLAEACAASAANGVDGAKITLQTISGEKYDSAYAYVNPKEPPRERTANAGSGSFSKFAKGPAKPVTMGVNKTAAFLKSKQVVSGDGSETN